MTTDAQLEANKQNAQRSTGPRTQQGKESSKRNATKHGLRSTLTVGPGEDLAEWEDFRNAVVESFEPRTVFQSELANRAASLMWRLRRVSRFENAVMAQAMNQAQHRIQERQSTIKQLRECDLRESLEKAERDHDEAVQLAELIEEVLAQKDGTTFRGDLVGWLYRELANPLDDEKMIFDQLGFDAADSIHYDQLEIPQTTVWRGVVLLAQQEGFEPKAFLADRCKMTRREAVRFNEDIEEAKQKLAEVVKENREHLALSEGAVLLLPEAHLNTLTRAEAHLMKQLASVLELLKPKSEQY